MGLLSLPKLLILFGVIFAFWWGVRYQKKKAQNNSKSQSNAQAQHHDNPNESGNEKKADKSIDDMVKCQICGIYYTLGAKDKRQQECGHETCPLK